MIVTLDFDGIRTRIPSFVRLRPGAWADGGSFPIPLPERYIVFYGILLIHGFLQ